MNHYKQGSIALETAFCAMQESKVADAITVKAIPSLLSVASEEHIALLNGKQLLVYVHKGQSLQSGVEHVEAVISLDAQWVALWQQNPFVRLLVVTEPPTM